MSEELTTKIVDTINDVMQTLMHNEDGIDFDDIIEQTRAAVPDAPVGLIESILSIYLSPFIVGGEGESFFPDFAMEGDGEGEQEFNFS